MIRVVIADDSPLLRRVLKDVLVMNPIIDVVGEGTNGKEAIDLVAKLKPDLLILDCEMPIMGGLEALKIVMAQHPLPVFMFSSLTSDGAETTLKALEYGALDFMPKPAKGALSLEEAAIELQEKVITVAIRGKFQLEKKPVIPKRKFPLIKKKLDILAVGSSTGGVKVIMDMVPKLKKGMPPIVWAQHMPPNFTESLAARLNKLSAITVREAKENDRIEPDLCLLAPGGKHMSLEKSGAAYIVKIQDGTAIPGPRPSCDALFNSVAKYFGSNSMGVILTGMGRDGADGLKRMHDKGAFVMGQNESSCIVYGMSKSAQRAGAVDEEATPDEIVQKINAIV